MLMQHRQMVKMEQTVFCVTRLQPSNFVQVGDKNFGDIVNEKIVNYGKDWANINLNDGKQAFLNPDKAKEKFAKAKESLQAQGVTFPIHLICQLTRLLS